MDISQPMVAAPMPKGQSLVIDPQLVQQRRMHVMNVDRVTDRRVPKLIRLPIRIPAAKPAAGKKDRVTVDVMVPPATG
jgi:hypothetical protein